jgi:hypothetical protein
MRRTGIALAVALAALLGVACASPSGGKAQDPGTGKAKDPGTKVLSGVVVEREREAPGSSGGASFQGTGNYYLIFEVKDGDATARYRYQVSYQQWFRYPEGSAVRITLRNNFLQDIKPE